MERKKILLWSPYSLLVSTPKGLTRKKCPFLVSKIPPKENGNGQAFVDLVSQDENGVLIFEIKGVWYPHNQWKIV